MLIEDYHIELTEEPVSVYNFQAEDFHTYFVGKNGVLVHNAQDYNDYEYEKYAEYLDDDYISKERVGRCNGKTPRNN